MSVESGYHGPINTDPKDGESGISIYGYVPSTALGVIATVTFAIGLCAHVYHLFARTKGQAKGVRTFRGLWSFGCLMEVIGYGFRIKSSYHPFQINAFIVQYFLIVCAPVTFSAAIYLALTIAVSPYDADASSEKRSKLLPIGSRMLVAIFVSFDVVTTVCQIAGAGLIGISESKRVMGESFPVTPDSANHILLVGLSIQSATFLAFLIILSVVLRRAFSSHSRDAVHRTLKRVLLVLLASALLVFLRTLFRLAETAQGIFGFASTHEALFGTLEYLPVVLAVSLWGAIPLGKVV